MKKLYILVAAACVVACLTVFTDMRLQSARSKTYAEECQLICLHYLRLNLKLANPRQLSDPGFVRTWKGEVEALLRQTRSLRPAADQVPVQEALTRFLTNQTKSLSKMEECVRQGNRKAFDNRFLDFCQHMSEDLRQLSILTKESGVDGLNVMDRLAFGLNRFQI